MKHRRLIASSIRFLVVTVLAMTLASLVHAQEAKPRPVRVYVMVGQSNMQGKGVRGPVDESGLRFDDAHALPALVLTAVAATREGRVVGAR